MNLKSGNLFTIILTTALVTCLTPPLKAAPDCSYHYIVTATGSTTTINNQNANCNAFVWQFSYTSNGFSALTLQLEAAPATTTPSNTPGAFSIASGLLLGGTNPGTGTAGVTAIQGYFPWVRLNLTSVTGTGVVNVYLNGWNDPSALGSVTSNGGGGGGGGSGTVNPGTTGQIAFYPSNGTAVSGESFQSILLSILTTNQDILLNTSGTIVRLPYVGDGNCLGGVSGAYTGVACAGGGGVAIPTFTGIAKATTSSGTLTQASLSDVFTAMGTIAANKFPAGPASGSPALATLRSIVMADLPFTLNGNTTKVATVNGTVASNDVATYDGNGNLVDLGYPTLFNGISAPANMWVPRMSASSTIISAALGLSNPTTATKLATFTGSYLATHFAAFNAAGDLIDGGAGTGVSVPTFTGVAKATTSSGALSQASLSDIVAAIGTIGANLVFSGPTTGSAASPVFRALVIADLPFFTYSGNTTKLATVSGSLTLGDCVRPDASGNIVDAGYACAAPTTASGSLTYTSLLDGTSADQTFTFSGVTTSTAIIPTYPAALPSGLIPVMWVSATNTVKVRVLNVSGSSYTGTLSFSASTGSGGGGGGGGGSITLINSTHGSVGVTNGTGPTVSLDVVTGGSGALDCVSNPYCDVNTTVVPLKPNAATITGQWTMQQLLFFPYTVSTLPTCNSGRAYQVQGVSDASSPTYLGTLTGGSSTKTPVFCDGVSTWRSF